MITIDGSRGEGGGQILRTSIALSLVTGKPCRIVDIRAGRRKPGLMRQHSAAVSAAAQIGQARVEGNSLGSRELTFFPAAVRAGTYRFDVGTAGSCTLVLQTVLPALLRAGAPSEVVLEGGTHNPFAPPFDFLERAFLPLLARMGAKVEAALERPGFYPAGGGRFTVRVEPVPQLSRIELLERGTIRRRRAKALVSRLPANIGRREIKTVQEQLSWEPAVLQVEEVKSSPGPGNVLLVEVESENVTEVFSGFGERGVSAETVAEQTVSEVLEYLQEDVPVGRHLADQLLMPMVLAGGGVFRTLPPTRHTRTNVEVIESFLDMKISMRPIGGKRWEIAASS
ncbi:MAG: RNA 3'-terminal phosphate cyclase [Planctomycetes bacterium]|nr:RNA 3'-terminal phosphate cyclase [Planctomycetota bacterium]